MDLQVWTYFHILNIVYNNTHSDKKYMTHSKIALQVLQTEIDGLQQSYDLLAGACADAFDMAVQEILKITANKGRLVVCGMGKSGWVGRKISATLASTGTPSYFVHPAEAVHGDLGMITTDDAILLLSNSGETAELMGVLTYIKRYNIFSIAMTKGLNSTLAKTVDVVIPLPQADEACRLGLAPTTSTTISMALGDCLAMALLESRDFTAHDFKNYHPSGQLGAKLLNAIDIMQTGDDLPFVHMNATVSETAHVMQMGRLGCVGVVQNDILQGVFTDGDLLRYINTGGDLQTKISACMTTDPITVTSQTVASEVLAILQDKKIGAVFVVDNTNVPLGVIHFQHCLKYGVA